MKINLRLYFIPLFLMIGCTNSKIKTETKIASTEGAVTNPLYKIAPMEYANLAEQAFNYMAGFEFDNWASMLADTVV